MALAPRALFQRFHPIAYRVSKLYRVGDFSMRGYLNSIIRFGSKSVRDKPDFPDKELNVDRTEIEKSLHSGLNDINPDIVKPKISPIKNFDDMLLESNRTFTPSEFMKNTGYMGED